MPSRFWRVIAAAIGSMLVQTSQAVAQDQPPPADPLTAKVDMSDVDRFVALLKAKSHYADKFTR